MDLPAVTSDGRVASPARRANSESIRLVSAEEVLDRPVAGGGKVGGNSPTKPSPTGTQPSLDPTHYGYDPQYRWIRGRLEYSEIDRSWKLRYIPIDGTTDQFGGSVVLSNPSCLNGWRHGEFIEVHGALGRRDRDTGGYAPEFEVGEIRRLGG